MKNITPKISNTPFRHITPLGVRIARAVVLAERHRRILAGWMMGHRPDTIHRASSSSSTTTSASTDG